MVDSKRCWLVLASEEPTSGCSCGVFQKVSEHIASHRHRASIGEDAYFSGLSIINTILMTNSLFIKETIFKTIFACCGCNLMSSIFLSTRYMDLNTNLGDDSLLRKSFINLVMNFQTAYGMVAGYWASALFFTAVGVNQPKDWPPLLALSEAYTVRRFWGAGW